MKCPDLPVCSVLFYIIPNCSSVYSVSSNRLGLFSPRNNSQCLQLYIDLQATAQCDEWMLESKGG